MAGRRTNTAQYEVFGGWNTHQPSEVQTITPALERRNHIRQLQQLRSLILLQYRGQIQSITLLTHSRVHLHHTKSPRTHKPNNILPILDIQSKSLHTLLHSKELKLRSNKVATQSSNIHPTPPMYLPPITRYDKTTTSTEHLPLR